MRKSFVLFFVVFVLLGLFFISASNAKMQDIKYSHVKVQKSDVKSSESAIVKRDPDFGNIPLYFIPNKGQVDGKARFYAKTSRYTLWMTKEGLVFDSMKSTGAIEVNEDTGNNHSKFKIQNSKLIKRDVSRLVFLGANKNPEMVPIKMTPHKVNYFKGKDPSKWQTGIQTSKAVLYKNVYKNIDLKVYGIEKQVEYDWIVKPGADPKAISFKYEEESKTRIAREGNLIVETKFGKLMHKKPVSFQVIDGQKVPVVSKFYKKGENTYGFKVKKYNKNHELIIDPVVALNYSTYLGGSGSENSETCSVGKGGLTIDCIGHIYVTGYTKSTDFPTKNCYQCQNAGGEDVFITKFNTDGSGLIYSTYLGGSDNDEGLGIEVTVNGYVYITGMTDSSDFPATNNYGGNRDAFIFMLNTEGSLKYIKYLGGNQRDEGHGIVVDRSNNVYVTGNTQSTDFPLLNPYQNAYAGNRDAFVSAFNSDGLELRYSTYLGGRAYDWGQDIVVDGSGSFYVTGFTFSSNFPTKNPFQSRKAGAYDGFVTKFKPNGAGLIYSTYIGGKGFDYFIDIEVDSSGSAYVSGHTASSDFPIKNAYQDALYGITDAFVTKLNPMGSDLIYSTYLGGTGNEYYAFLAVDSSNHAYLSGRTYSNDFPTKNAYQPILKGIMDAFVVRFSSDGSDLVYSTYLGGAGSDICQALEIDSSGNVYITGCTSSTNFPTKNPFQGYNAGGYDVFISTLSFTYDLTVQSTPNTGVPITVTPNDINGNGDGNTEFTRTYNPGEVVTLTAPETFKDKTFYKWTIDSTNNLNRSIQVTMDGQHTVTAVYQAVTPTRTLTVQSTPDTGVPITVTPNDNNGKGNGNTVFKRTYNVGMVVTLTAPETFSGKIFNKWIIDGTNNLNRSIKVTMDGNHTVTAVYQTVTPTGTLTVQSTPNTGVPITVRPNDNNGDGNGNTSFTRIYNVGTVVTLTASETFNDNVFYKWTIDGSDNFDSSFQVTMDGNYTVTAVYQTLAIISLSRTQFNFGCNSSGISTGPLSFFISNSGESTLNWTVGDNVSWLKCDPEEGTNFGEVTVSVNGVGLPAGAYFGEIMVSAPDAANSPQWVYVTLIVYDPGDSNEPFGFFETPTDGSTVSGSVPVTGWALDDIEVENVKIYREEGSNLAYIGEAVFVEGARPDVEQAYPNYPKCYQAGWGYMMLTNFLPDGGNGTFTLHAIATDKEGIQVTLGTKTIFCDNAHAVRPFGAIDTPAQGGTASGSNYRNQGWVLTPLPNKIPEDGHTIIVWIDGVNLGNPIYNIYRADIATLFPGYANSNGALAYFDFDTTTYTNGVHTIYWVASDDAGNVDGIGSRYFTIRNSGARSVTSSQWPVVSGKHILSEIPLGGSLPVEIIKGFNRDVEPLKIYPDGSGIIMIEIRELERIEIYLNDYQAEVNAKVNEDSSNNSKFKIQNSKFYCGFQVVGPQLRPLPMGSTLDIRRGIFYWHPGPGYVGEYWLVFIEKDQYGKMIRRDISVNIIPKF